jgi:hypothetical protein
MMYNVYDFLADLIRRRTMSDNYNNTPPAPEQHPEPQAPNGDSDGQQYEAPQQGYQAPPNPDMPPNYQAQPNPGVPPNYQAQPNPGMPPNYQAPPNPDMPPNYQNYQQPPYGQQPYYGTPVNEGLRTAAFVLNLIATIIAAFSTFGIALAWGIPMTVMTYRIIKSPYKHIGLGVCSIIFLGFIGGILILCSGGRDKETYYQTY